MELEGRNIRQAIATCSARTLTITLPCSNLGFISTWASKTLIGVCMEEADQTHSRGELEIALWQTFTQGDRGPKVDRTFKGRIQKLLDLDRAGGFGAPSEFAFHAAAPPGRGQEVHFTLLDAFCLAIGLDLLDVGFKQSEVVFLLRHLRKDQADKLLAIRSDPPVLRGPLDQGDTRCFMVL
ncbi:MAG: hypothetical protein RIC85_04375 [Gammaproteobacteria bacterium]